MSKEFVKNLPVVPIRNFNPTLVKPLDRLQTELPRVTSSSINDLMGCPEKYRRLRVERNWPYREPILATAHGTAVHWVVMNVYQSRRGGEPDLTNVMALARDAVRRGRYPKEIDREEQIRRVVDDVRAFAQADDAEDVDGTIGLEVQGEFLVTYEGIPLYLMSATLDRVLIRITEKSRLVVRELKTGVPRVDLRVAYVILRVAKKLYPDFASYALEIDSFDGEHRVTRDIIEGKELNGQHAIISERAREVFLAGRQGNWPRVSGDSCTYCPSRQSCVRCPAEETIDENKEIF